MALYSILSRLAVDLRRASANHTGASTWTPTVCETLAVWAPLRGFGPLFCTLLTGMHLSPKMAHASVIPNFRGRDQLDLAARFRTFCLSMRHSSTESPDNVGSCQISQRPCFGRVVRSVYSSDVLKRQCLDYMPPACN